MEGILQFDRSLLIAFNSLAHQSPLLDNLVLLVTGHPLLEGSFFIVFLWWFWFQNTGNCGEHICVIRAVVGLYAALIVARTLQTLLPRRIRPINDPELHLVTPFGGSVEWNTDWSSFPSDHAVVVAAIATAI